MKRAGLLLLWILMGNNLVSAKSSSEYPDGPSGLENKDSKGTSGFLIHKEKYHMKLTPVVDKSIFSIIEMGTCEVKIEPRANDLNRKSEANKYKISVELNYRLCQKVDYYQAKDVSYFGLIHRKGLYDNSDYRKTRYISQDDDEAEKKFFRVGSVNFKTLAEIEVEKNKIYTEMNSNKINTGSKNSLASLERDEDILKNVLEQTIDKCESFKEKILKNENKSNENFCEE